MFSILLWFLLDNQSQQDISSPLQHASSSASSGSSSKKNAKTVIPIQTQRPPASTVSGSSSVSTASQVAIDITD
jgi:hypothetical protein